MHKELKRFIVKMVIYLFIITVLGIVVSTFEPLLNNEIAIAQMTDGDFGFAQLTFYNKLKECSFYGSLSLFIIMFGADFIRIVKAIINKIKNTQESK